MRIPESSPSNDLPAPPAPASDELGYQTGNVNATEPILWPPTGERTLPSAATESIPVQSTVERGDRGRRREVARTAGTMLVAAAVGYAGIRGLEHIAGGMVAGHSQHPHVSEAGLSILGLRRWKASERRAKRADDAQFYREAADENLKAIGYERDPATGNLDSARQVKAAYDPLERFDTAHRTRRLTQVPSPDSSINLRLGTVVPKQKPRPQQSEARTALQEMSAHRNSNRGHRINRRDGRIDALTELYERYDLQNKERLEQQLEATRLTKAQRAAILRAGREVRKLERGRARDMKRLNRAAKGGDIPGKYLAKREAFDDRVTATRQKVYRGASDVARKSGKALKAGFKKVGTTLPRKSASAARSTGKAIKVAARHSKKAYHAVRTRLHR